MKVRFNSKTIERGHIGRLFTHGEKKVVFIEAGQMGKQLMGIREHVSQQVNEPNSFGTHSALLDEFYCIGKGNTEEEAVKDALFQEHEAKCHLLHECEKRGWKQIQVYSGIRKDLTVIPISKPVNPFLLGLPAGTPVDSNKFPNYMAEKILSLGAYEEHV